MVPIDFAPTGSPPFSHLGRLSLERALVVPTLHLLEDEMLIRRLIVPSSSITKCFRCCSFDLIRSLRSCFLPLFVRVLVTRAFFSSALLRYCLEFLVPAPWLMLLSKENRPSAVS